jgi:uncharacterized lipoprotein YmbA
MTTTRRTLAALIVVAASLLNSACSRSPRVTYYTLTPATSAQGAPPSPTAPAVAVGPVTIPELVNRPQLVVRQTPNRVDVLESHRWAEPLKSEIPRLMAQNLAQLLGSSRVIAYGQAAGSEPRYRVLVDIIRMEAVPGESVTVEAGWLVRGAASVSREGRGVFREKVSGAGYEPVALALSRALGDLSCEVAKTIQGEAAAPR